jgi:AcrR family transcriptional regulator
VLEAALDVFVARGFAATRMDDIAAHAGVSKGTIYLYYPSKQAIFEALVRANLIPTLERAEALLTAPGGSAAAKLRQILGFMGEAIANPRLVAIPKLVLTEAGNFPEMASFYRREVVGRGLALLESLLRCGIAAGEFHDIDPRPAARLFMAPVILTALWQTTFAPIEETPLSSGAVLSLHTELFLRAIVADPRKGTSQ